MAVETRVIIDANASNAIREIDKLDEAAQDADKTIAKLDGQDVDVDTSGAVHALGDVGQAATAAGGDVDKLDAKSASVHVDFDVDADKLDRLKSKTDEVESSGRAASTAIGGIGNTVSELPGVGALGGMAESMGQLTEGALEGEVALGELAATAGGLALVALAAKGIQGHFEKIAAAKAFKAEQVKKWADALREGQTLLEAINDELAETGQLEFQGWDGLVDIVPILADAGLKVADWTAAVEGNDEAQHEFLATLQASGVSHEAFREILVALKIESENFDTAQRRTADALAVTSKEADKATVAYHGALAAVKDLAGGLDDTTVALKQLEAANAKLRGELDQRQAYLNLLDAFDDLKVKGQEAWDAAATGADDAESKARDYEQAQLDVKQQVIDYTEQIGKVPTDITTDLVTKVDSGELDTLKHDVDILTLGVKTVDVRVRTTVDTAWNNLINTVRLGGTRI